MTLNKVKYLFYLLITPLTLIMMAGFQQYLAHTHHLTPWKGGGFGMFSTIDSPRVRFLRIYLLTETGEYPVEVPHDQQVLAREIRSIPTPQRLAYFTQTLAQAQWVSSAEVSQDKSPSQALIEDICDDQAAIIAQKHPDLSLFEQPLDDVPNLNASHHLQPQFQAIGPDAFTPKGTIPVVIQGVRAELWRYTFDASNNLIQAEKFLENIAQRNP